MGNQSNISTDNVVYCGKGLDDFHTGYLSMHGYISILVCIFGSIANSLNIIVLTRREMRSPTNAILTGLAIADLLVMIDYIPFACIGYILPQLNYSREDQLTYSWSWYVLFHSIWGQIMHTTAIWLTVTLAIWRYIAVAHPQKNRLWCNMRTTLKAIGSSYVCIIPTTELLNASGFPLKANNTDGGRNVTLYKVGRSELAINNESLLNANLWMYVAIKLIPCVALTILSLRLICALLEAKRRRKQLTGNSAGMKVIVNGKALDKTTKNNKTLEKEKQTDRTTRMLLAVLLLFLITEFPQGILGLLSALLGFKFFTQCYLKLVFTLYFIQFLKIYLMICFIHLYTDDTEKDIKDVISSCQVMYWEIIQGDFMDILALLNSAINFILYCSMSRQFRITFTILFRPKFIEKWIPVAQDEDENNLGRTDIGKDNNGHTTIVTQV